MKITLASEVINRPHWTDREQEEFRKAYSGLSNQKSRDDLIVRWYKQLCQNNPDRDEDFVVCVVKLTGQSAFQINRILGRRGVPRLATGLEGPAVRIPGANVFADHV